MNLGALATLVAIVDRGSFAAAAQAVGCTPSAVSLQVKQLEAWFGRPLFDRSGRSARPTDFAREAAAGARECLDRLSSMRTRTGAAIAGRIRLGAIATVQADALPHALRTLRDRHPVLEVEVRLDDSPALQAALKAGAIDAAVLVRPASGGSSRLEWRDLVRQPYVMLAPRGEAAATPRELLQHHPLLGYDPALTGGRIAAAYARRTFPRARRAMDLRSIDAIVAMVSARLGVAIVPRPRQGLLDSYGVRAIPLGRRAPTRQIAFAGRRGDWGSRNLEAVLAALIEAFGGK